MCFIQMINNLHLLCGVYFGCKKTQNMYHCRCRTSIASDCNQGQKRFQMNCSNIKEEFGRCVIDGVVHAIHKNIVYNKHVFSRPENVAFSPMIYVGGNCQCYCADEVPCADEAQICRQEHGPWQHFLGNCRCI